jgi:hypothetical protein
MSEDAALHVLYQFLWKYRERLSLSLEAEHSLPIAALARILTHDEDSAPLSLVVVALLRGIGKRVEPRDWR